jgi:hypothetical protein
MNFTSSDTHPYSYQPFGYRKKPFRVYFVALYLLIAPWINFVLGIRNTGESQWYHVHTWLEYLLRLHPRTWTLLILTLFAGVFLLMVRKASWIFAWSLLLAVIFYNLIIFNDLPILALVLLFFVLLTPFKRVMLLLE